MSWVPKAISQAAESGACATSGPRPHLPLGLRISASRKALGSHGRPGPHKASEPAHGAGSHPRSAPAPVRQDVACGGRTPAEGGPRWLPWRRQEEPPPARRGGGEGLRGEMRSRPPPVRYLGPAGTRPEGLPAVARTAMFCRIPVPGADTQPPPGSRAPAAASWVGQRRRGPLGMSRGPSAPLRTHFSARSRPTRGSDRSFRRPL